MPRFLGRLVRLPLRLTPGDLVTSIKTGPLRGARWITGSAPHGCWLGTYERDSQRAFVENIREGDTIYDIGANAGFFTLLASKLAGARGTVYAFEPLPSNVAFLERHVALNESRNVRILQFAVAAQSGTARFDLSENSSQGGISDRGDLEVETCSLDDVMERGAPPPQFMKIDVEGAESEVLAGASRILRESHPAILLSTHGWKQHEVCCSMLRDRGYELALVRNGTADGNYVLLASFPVRRS